ncbi:MAG: hypothetical protein ACTHKH_07535 [Trinickia sp.]
MSIRELTHTYAVREPQVDASPGENAKHANANPFTAGVYKHAMFRTTIKKQHSVKKRRFLAKLKKPGVGPHAANRSGTAHSVTHGKPSAHPRVSRDANGQGRTRNGRQSGHDDEDDARDCPGREASRDGKFDMSKKAAKPAVVEPPDPLLLCADRFMDLPSRERLIFDEHAKLLLSVTPIEQGADEAQARKIQNLIVALLAHQDTVPMTPSQLEQAAARTEVILRGCTGRALSLHRLRRGLLRAREKLQIECKVEAGALDRIRERLCNARKSVRATMRDAFRDSSNGQTIAVSGDSIAEPIKSLARPTAGKAK